MNALLSIDRQSLKQSIAVWTILEKGTEDFIKWVIGKEFFKSARNVSGHYSNL